MTLRGKLETDLKEALRAGDRTRLTALRLALAAIHNAEIDKGGSLTEAEVLGVLQKEAKKYRESIVEFEKGNRPDLVTKEQAELAVIERYMPEQLSREEVADLARRIADEVGAQGPRDMGKVMPRLMAEIRGRADGKVASQVVQEILAAR
ncbi:MAG: GatB/YqeY domain-containing protein [Dehalococcoidales bacterium]|nr:GatB/YqeY domain-containing protein [Dehalococcoidales bacterium]